MTQRQSIEERPTTAPTITIARVPNRLSPVNLSQQLVWESLAKLLSAVTVGSKDGTAWMPVVIQPGQRKTERVEAITALVLDIEAKDVEQPPAPGEVMQTISARGWRCLLHTSYSHNPNAPRYRLVFALSRPLAPSELRQLALHTAGLLGLSSVVDTACMEPARLFYLPRCAEDAGLSLFEFHQADGAPLDVDALLAEAPPPTTKSSAAKRPNPEAEQDAEIFSEGGRNDGLFRMGCALRAKGLSAAGIEAALLAENIERCAPPLDAAEVKRIAKSASEYQLGATLGGETDADAVKRLAALPLLDYDRCRTMEAERMGLQRVAVLDKLVDAARKTLPAENTTETPFKAVDPCADPVVLAEVLDEIAVTIHQHIVLTRAQGDAVALWAAFTWFIDVAKVAPLLVIDAPEPACGKSQLADLLAKIVLRPLPTNNMRSATMFRIAECWHPTLVLDEVDSMMKSDDEMVNLINAGHHRGACDVWRLVGDNHEPKAFNVWGAKAFAGIRLHALLPPATMSRAVVINMRRKTRRERVISLLDANDAPFDRLAAKLARAAQDYASHVAKTIPVMSEALEDRQRDNWRILLAIAICASPAWYERGHSAVLELAGLNEATKTRGNDLLADIRQIWAKAKVDRFTTSDLIAALKWDEEAPWATYDHGKPITPRQLSNLLADYGIKSKVLRLDAHTTKRGYERAQFDEVFTRYLDEHAENAHSFFVDGLEGDIWEGQTPSFPENLDASVTTSQTNSHKASGVSDASVSHSANNLSETLKSAPMLGCYAVTDKTEILEDVAEDICSLV